MRDLADAPQPIPGSYRDPRGRVYAYDRRIFRTVSDSGLADVDFCFSSGFFSAARARGLLVKTDRVSDPAIAAALPAAPLVLEHERIPFVSFPYEWTFVHLKKAALAHLDL